MSQLRTIIYDFGGVIVFWALWKLVSLKAAIAGTLVFVAFDIWRRRRHGIGFPRIYVLTTAMAIVFGGIDLVAKTPFMLKYEGAVSTFIVAAFFAVGARGRSPIEELMAQQGGAEAVAFPHARRFFQLMTLALALIFFIKAAFFAWVSVHFPYARAIVIRQIAGYVSLGVIVAASLGGRYYYAACQAVGLIPRTPDTELAALRDYRATKTEVEGTRPAAPS